MNEVVKDYLWTYNLETIDNNKLYNTCCNVEEFLKKRYPEPRNNTYGCFTSYHHRKYNLFLFACPELHKLYREICNKALNLLDKNKIYYIRCWPNLFKAGYNINWHGHWGAESKTFHGFYCVNTEGGYTSYTDYRIPGHSEEIRVPSKDGLLVIGKSENDKHRSSVWDNKDKFRVTVAFDIIPHESLKPLDNFHDDYYHTNYVPFFKELI